ncbi:MAG: hypothetical protein ACI9OH_001472 [Oleispira sp.]|jgi:hypothetical protein
MRYRSTFQKLIDELDQYEWYFDVYSKVGSDISPITKILIIDDEGEDERDEFDEPTYPGSKGYALLMSIADLRAVLENMEQGCDEFTIDKEIEAVVHYYYNDSFMY